MKNRDKRKKRNRRRNTNAAATARVAKGPETPVDAAVEQAPEPAAPEALRCPSCGFTRQGGDVCPLCSAGADVEAAEGSSLAIVAAMPTEMSEAWEESRTQAQRMLGGDPLVAEFDPHITLLYLGAADEDRLPEIVDAAEAALAGVAPIKVKPSGMSWFDPTENSDGRTPIILDYGDVKGLPEINDALIRGLAPYINATQFPAFRAHVTLGYLDRELTEAEKASLENAAVRGLAWTVDALGVSSNGETVGRVELTEPTQAVTKKMPMELTDRARQGAVAGTSDDDLLGLHNEMHEEWSADDDDQGSWFNGHHSVVLFIEERGGSHPAPPSGSKGLDELGQEASVEKGGRPAASTSSPDTAPPCVVRHARIKAGGSPDGDTVRIQTTRFFKSELDDGDDIWIGIVYEPFTLDSHGQWMRPEWIKRAGNLYGMYHARFNDEHQRDLPAGEALLAQNWVVPADYTDGDELITEGTWAAGVKLFGETLARAEAGEFNGFSLEGPGLLVDHASIDYAAIEGEPDPA